MNTLGALSITGHESRRTLVEPWMSGNDIRGRGLFWAVEFMRKPELREPFPIDDDFSQRVVREALETQELQVLANMGFPGVWKVDSVVICPPFIVTKPELHEIVKRPKAHVDVVSVPYLD